MAPGALGEQFNHSADLRVALNKDYISFANDLVEIIHVVYYVLLIIFSGRLKASEDPVSQVLNEFLNF